MLNLNEAFSQNAVVSLMIGLSVGIYGALTSLGAGGGPPDAVQLANLVNTVSYIVYFAGGLVSGSIVKLLGPKYSLVVGSLGYPIYVSGFWYFTIYAKRGYPIFCGVFIGATAVLLWTTAEYIAFAYPPEDRKGTYLSMQWGALAVCSTIACLMAFGINYHASQLQVPNAVYIVFTCIMASNIFTALFLIKDPSQVRRKDGRKVPHYLHKGLWVELRSQLKLLKDWRMLVLVVPFFASEIAIIITSTLNGLYFNIRTRTLNAVVFYVMQALGAAGITFTLDWSRFGTRRMRGLMSIGIMGSIVVAGWIGLTVWLYRNPPNLEESPLWDWTDSAFGGFFVLNLIFGMNMAIYQIVAQWIVSALTNDPEVLARYAGFAKGCLGGGLAASFGIESSGISQFSVVAFMFTIQAVGLVCMVVVCGICVKPTSDENDTMSISYESQADAEHQAAAVPENEAEKS